MIAPAPSVDAGETTSAIEGQPPYLTVENMTLRPLNAFRGFRPAPGQEPEINVQLDVAGYAFAEPERK